MHINPSKAEKIKMLNSADLYAIMQKVLLREDKIDQDREHFWILGLANNNRLLFVELISLGTVNATLVVPMEVFSFALQKRAVKIILCHNHPSGELKPSEQDKDITDRLLQIGTIVKMPVLDHIIITDQSYLSFADIGLLDELKKSLKYVPSYELAERIRAEAAAITEQKLEEARYEMAKGFKEKGVAVATIAEVTGLSVEEIENL